MTITQLLNYLNFAPFSLYVLPFSLTFPPFGQNMLNSVPTFAIVASQKSTFRAEEFAVRQFS
jgi:hypothetical protein